MRLFLSSLGVAALSTLASAQAVGAEVYPITAKPRHAGTYDVATGRFVQRNAKVGTPAFTIYDNTCSWSGGQFYVATDTCEDVYDEGRIPQDWIPQSAMSVYSVSSLEVSYCTNEPTGSVDIDVALFDTDQLGGECVGDTPPIGAAPLFEFVSAAQGFPLPGSNGGGLSCWIITLQVPSGAPLQAITGSDHLFNWRFRQNNASGQNGPVLAGEPSVTPGNGTFGMALDPNPCGSGLGSADLYWLNIDNAPVGSNPTGCGAFGGTGCYWFGGYPSNPFASFWFRVQATSQASSCSVASYCTAKVNSQGCAPQLSFAGCPSATVDEAFVISCSGLIPSATGVFLYSTGIAQANAFQGGLLCVGSPVGRTAAQMTATVDNACAGFAAADFNATIQHGGDAGLASGATVGVQFYSRDAGDAFGTSLSNAVSFTIAP